MIGLKFFCLLLLIVPLKGMASTSVLGDTTLSAGARALQAGDIESGIALTLAGLETTTARLKRASGFSNLCAGYTYIEDYEAAVVACDQALELNQHNWRALNNRALALAGLGRYHEARLDLQSAGERAPASPTVARTRDWIDARSPRLLIASARTSASAKTNEAQASEPKVSRSNSIVDHSPGDE